MSTTEKINVIIDIKKTIVSQIHPQRDVILSAIVEFKKAFNTNIISLNEKLEEKKREFERLTTEMSKENEIYLHRSGELTTSLDTERKNFTLFDNNMNEKNNADLIKAKQTEENSCDQTIEKLNNETKLVEEKIQTFQNNLTLLKTEIANWSSKKNELEKQFQAVKFKVSNFSNIMVISDESLVELMKESESKTKTIEEAVNNDFTFYEDEISENNAKIVVDVNNSNGTTKTTPEKKTSSGLFPKCPFAFDIIDDPMKKPWSGNQTNEYKLKLYIYARTQNSGRDLDKEQLKRLRENVQSSQKQACPLNHPSKTSESWYDVSASEVDISEFSMDELAAHVENLTAELRAL